MSGLKIYSHDPAFYLNMHGLGLWDILLPWDWEVKSDKTITDFTASVRHKINSNESYS